MKISVITVCFNSAETLRDNLESVKNQTYENIEHIIIDGGSSDNTLGILSTFKNDHVVVSEKDSGIYNAMNKGISLASGEIIGFLNSDDYFYSDDVVKQYADGFSSTSNKIIFGDLQFVSKQNKNNTILGIFQIF